MTGMRTFAGSDPRVELCSPWSQRNGGYDALRSSLGRYLANRTHELRQQRCDTETVYIVFRERPSGSPTPRVAVRYLDIAGRFGYTVRGEEHSMDSNEIIRPTAHETCAFDNCPAYWTGIRWANPETDLMPDYVLDHQHETIGGKTFVSKNDEEVRELCDGDPEPPHHSSQYQHALEAAMNYLEARRLYEDAYRILIGRTLLVPREEHRELTAAVLAEYQARGFELPRERGVTFVDVSDMFR